MANALDITLLALATKVADAAGEWIDIDAIRSAAELDLQVTALTGALTVTIETSRDAVNARQVGSFGSVGTVPQRITKSFHGLDRYVRAKWDVGTTATLAVTGRAHQLFATEADMQAEVPAAVLDGIDPSKIADALIKASSDVEDALATGYQVPITVWPHSVRQRCATIAAYRSMKARGFQPDSPDELIAREHKDAQAWLQKVASGLIRPPGMTPQDNLGVKASSGDAANPQTYPDKFSSNWGDFG